MGSVLLNYKEISNEEFKAFDFESLCEKTNDELVDALMQDRSQIPKVDVDAESDNGSEIY